MIRVADLKAAALAVMIVLGCAVSGPAEDREGQTAPSATDTLTAEAKTFQA